MNYQSQTGTKDCFPTSFRNAMLHFGITVTPVLMERLAVFNNGTENCTIHVAQERLEIYSRSLNKFIAEWNWATCQRDGMGSSLTEPEEWAQYLIEIGIDIDARNGPIENKKVIIDSLNMNKVVICDIWIPSIDFPDSKSKHYVLLVKIANSKLFLHDPLPANWNRKFDSDKVTFAKNECGTNYVIDCDYFFSNEINYMKPKPNQKRSDCDYSFLIVSRR